MEKFDGKLAATCFPDTRICFCKMIFHGKSIMGFITIKSHRSGGICLELFPSIEQTKPRKLNHHVWFLWLCLLNKVKIEGKAREASYEFGSKTTRHELKWYAGGFFILVWDGCYVLI